jgi:hypothetical protein
MADRDLKIKLFKGWTRVEQAVGGAVFSRSAAENVGRLQFSHAEFKGGELPEASEEKLLAVCRSLATKATQVTHTSERSGDCDFGKFGTMVVRAASPVYFQVWVLSDGRDFILITHTCVREPDAVEIFEANEIALMTRLSERA